MRVLCVRHPLFHSESPDKPACLRANAACACVLTTGPRHAGFVNDNVPRRIRIQIDDHMVRARAPACVHACVIVVSEWVSECALL